MDMDMDEHCKSMFRFIDYLDSYKNQTLSAIDYYNFMNVTNMHYYAHHYYAPSFSGKKFVRSYSPQVFGPTEEVHHIQTNDDTTCLEEINLDHILEERGGDLGVAHSNDASDGCCSEEIDLSTLVPTIEEPPTKVNYPVRSVHKEIEVGEMHVLSDLIALMEKYPVAEPNTKYNIDLAALLSVREDLKEMDSMIGMGSLKTVFMEQLLYFLQKFHKPSKSSSSQTQSLSSQTQSLSSQTQSLSSQSLSQDFKHTVIYGPPGTGKTEVAKLIGRIYSKIGILKNNVFKKATRNDLVAGYLGQTAIKTRNLVKDCLGGVLFIDEAYSLGTGINSGGGQDSYSKECIDTLCESLSDCKNDLMVIVAGYQMELEEQFFSANPGLESRFVWRFSIESYTSSELLAIFRKKMEEQGWVFEVSEFTDNMEAWFKTNHKEFTSFGRDMEVLLFYVKIAHSKRVFGKSADLCRRRAITKEDLNAGFQTYLKNRKMKKNPSDEKTRLILESMYV